MEKDFFDLSQIHVKLYDSFFGKYMYDIPTGDLVCITDKLYNYLKNNSKSHTDELQNEIMGLYRDGYLKANSIKNIKYDASVLENKLKFEENVIILQLTQKCNLKCKYCAYEQGTVELQRMESNNHMTLKTAKQAIDFLYSRSEKCDTVDICFYGGEPLLEYNLIQNLVLYCEEKFQNKKIAFNITTNGTLLTNEMLEFMANHRFSITVSLDGPESIHNINRISKNNKLTFNIVENNLKKMIKALKGSNSTIRINSVLDGTGDLILYDEYMRRYTNMGLNVSAVIIDKVFLPNFQEVNSVFIEQYNYRKFLCVLSVFNIEMKITIPLSCREFYEKLKNSFEIININGLKETVYPTGRCDIGNKRMYVDVNGNILPCEKISEKDEQFYIGDIWNGFDIKKIDHIINQPSKRYEDCKRCYGITKCNLCARYIVNEDMVFGKENLYCKTTLNSVDEYFKLLVLFNEIKENKMIVPLEWTGENLKVFLKSLWRTLNCLDIDTEIDDNGLLTYTICDQPHNYIMLAYYYIILKKIFNFKIDSETLLQTEFNTISNIYKIINS